MRGFNYPVPVGDYKLTVTRGGGWKKHSHCRIQMSLRNKKYESSKLLAMLEWASARFEKVTFVLSDTLLRHNLMHEKGVSEVAAYLQAKKEGDDWLERNSLIKGFEKIEVVRWSEYINRDTFDDVFFKLFNFYTENSEFRHAVNNVVKRFWSRRKNSLGTYELFAEHGVNYVLEELAVFGDVFKESAVDVYAGQWCSECIEVLRDSDIVSGYGKAHYLEVDLVRNKAKKIA